MSLSAILLNDEYYQLLKRGTIIVDGLSVLRSECLILFKIKAWLDLTDRKEKGERIDGKDIRKHRNDVIRLVSMMDNNLTFQIEECIRHDVEMFLKMNYQHPINTKSLGLNNVSFEQILKRIEDCYLKSNS